MKKTYLTLIFSLATAWSFSQVYSNGYQNEKVPLEINSTTDGLDIRNQLTALKYNTPTTNGLLAAAEPGLMTDDQANCTVNFTWQGIGPFGQVDVRITSGSAPFKIYIGGSLVYSGSNRFVTVQSSCNGGTIRVDANTPCGVVSAFDIIPQGCADF